MVLTSGGSAFSFDDADIEFEPSVTVLTEDTVLKNGILYMVLPKKQPKVPANRRLEIR